MQLKRFVLFVFLIFKNTLTSGALGENRPRVIWRRLLCRLGWVSKNKVLFWSGTGDRKIDPARPIATLLCYGT